MEKWQAVNQYIQYAIKLGSFMPIDAVYLQNKLNKKLKLQVLDFPKLENSNLHPLDEILDTLLVNIDKSDREDIKNELLDLLTPPTSVVNAFFAQTYQQNAKDAVDNYYQLMTFNQSIQKDTQNNIQINDLFQLDFTKSTIQSEGNYPLQRRIIRLNIQQESYGFSFCQTPLFYQHAVICSEYNKEKNNQEMIQHLFTIQEIFPNLQIIYNSFDNANNQKRIFQCTTDENISIPVDDINNLFSLKCSEVEIKQLNTTEDYLVITSENINQLKLILNQLIYGLECEYKNISLLSKYHQNQLTIYLKLYKEDDYSYFNYNYQQLTSKHSLEKKIKKIVG